MRSAILTLAAAACLLPCTSLAYSINLTDGGFIIRWSKPNVEYYVNPTGSADISNGSDLNAITAAFSDWTAIGCSALTFQKLGNVNTTTVLANGAEPNGKNELVWVENNSWKFGQYTLAVTSPVVYTNGHMVEADIAFNGYLNKWSTTGQFGRADVKSVAIHEIGHMFGLQHNLGGFNQNDPPTMAPVADPYGKTASLETDDTYGPCFLYPAGASFTCSSAAMCPYVVEKNVQSGQESYTQKLNCNAGLCQFAQGGGTTTKKALGEECFTETECQAALFCQPIQGGGGFCSQFCDPDKQDCPNGYGCFPYSNADGGACLPADKPKKGNGEPCSGSDECDSALCYPSMTGGWQCRKGCEDDAACPNGELCFWAPGYPTAACMPESLIPSYKVQDGDPCNADADCESGVCVLNPGSGGPKFCRSPCDPAAPTCGFGFECAALGPLGGACVPAPDETPPGQEGDPCVNGSDCATDTCFGGLCKRSCNVLSATTCDAASEACQRITADALAGVCEPHGGVPLAMPCNTDADCWSRFCEPPDSAAGRRCLTPCPPGGDDCPGGEVCAILPTLTLLGACAAASVPADPVDDTGTGTGADPPVGGGSPYVSKTVTTCASSGAPAGPAAPFALLLITLYLTRRRIRA